MLRAGCTSGEAARGCQARHPRTERSANRPRRSQVHHPRASRTIRGAFLARPATGRNWSLGRRSPRLGGLFQILATLGNTCFPKKTRFLRPPPLHTYMRTRPSPAPPLHRRARNVEQTALDGRRHATCRDLARFVGFLIAPPDTFLSAPGIFGGQLASPGPSLEPPQSAPTAPEDPRFHPRLQAAVHRGTTSRDRQTLLRARKGNRIVPDRRGCTTREHRGRFVHRFSRGLRRGGFGH